MCICVVGMELKLGPLLQVPAAIGEPLPHGVIFFHMDRGLFEEEYHMLLSVLLTDLYGNTKCTIKVIYYSPRC